MAHRLHLLALKSRTGFWRICEKTHSVSFVSCHSGDCTRDDRDGRHVARARYPSSSPDPQAQQPSSSPDTTQTPPPQSQEPSTSQSPSSQTQQQTPDTNRTPDTAAPSQAPSSANGAATDSQVFSGTVVKSGDKFMLKDDSGHTYDIDHQDEVKKFEGKRVRVQGTLDPTGNKIMVK